MGWPNHPHGMVWPPQTGQEGGPLAKMEVAGHRSSFSFSFSIFFFEVFNIF
jgi:hypothetical protein